MASWTGSSHSEQCPSDNSWCILSAIGRIPTYDEIVAEDISEEEKELEREENFEHKYNFRYEEPGSDVVSFLFLPPEEGFKVDL